MRPHRQKLLSLLVQEKQHVPALLALGHAARTKVGACNTHKPASTPFFSAAAHGDVAGKLVFLGAGSRPVRLRSVPSQLTCMPDAKHNQSVHSVRSNHAQDPGQARAKVVPYHMSLQQHAITLNLDGHGPQELGKPRFARPPVTRDSATT